MRETFTDTQVEAEISKLLASDDVKLAKAEQRIKNRRRQYMYCLRTLERRGKELSEQGYTVENIEMMFGEDIDQSSVSHAIVKRQASDKQAIKFKEETKKWNQRR